MVPQMDPVPHAGKAVASATMALHAAMDSRVKMMEAVGTPVSPAMSLLRHPLQLNLLNPIPPMPLNPILPMPLNPTLPTLPCSLLPAAMDAALWTTRIALIGAAHPMILA